MSAQTILLLEKIGNLREAYVLLKPYVDNERYFAYITGVLDSLDMLQAYEESQRINVKVQE